MFNFNFYMSIRILDVFFLSFIHSNIDIKHVVKIEQVNAMCLSVIPVSFPQRQHVQVWPAYLMNCDTQITLDCLDETHPDISISLMVWVSLKESLHIIVNWFNDNYMQANPGKFQLIIFGTSCRQEPLR